MNLTAILAIPTLTLLAVLLVPRARQARWAALAGAVAQLAASLWLLVHFREARSSGDSGFLFQWQHAWYADWNIQFHLGVDGISVAMILLTALVVVAGVLVSWEEERMSKTFFGLLTLLGLGAYGFFCSLDLFAMFFFLEVAVVPKFLLIALWGSGRKEYSANKLAIMLMGASVAILMGIIALMYSAPGGQWSFDMLHIAGWEIPADTQTTIFALIFIGFGVFTALFPFHTWVPDGHSSAPTAGSMFLAGISMKLGGYGCLRAAVWLLPKGAVAYGDTIVVLSVVAILYGAFVTLMQTDLKYINAYSSVSHCGFVLLGIGMLTKAAVAGAVLQMVSHGLMTALFFAVIGMVYARTHTRQVSEMGGLMRAMPFIAVLMFLAGLSSLGLPGLSGFVAEMSVFVGGWERGTNFHQAATLLAAMSIVVTAVYVLRAIGATMMGPLRQEAHSSLTDAAWYERVAALVLTAGMLAMGLAPEWLNELVGPDAAAIADRLAAP